MTREEMLSKYEDDTRSMTKDVNVIADINKIYDDFENRVCENCEEFKISKGFNGVEFTCYKGYGCTNEYGYIFTEKDFGCTEFKRKAK